MKIRSTKWRLLCRIPGYAGLRFLYNLLRGGEHRIHTLLRLRRPKGLFQPYGTTLDDRYPSLFRQILSDFGDTSDRRLLSFGCSTGEEVFTLRRYFPHAYIKGIDISGARISVCRTRHARMGGDHRLAFEQAGSADGESAESYDAVFALAVFRHGDLGERPPMCDHLIRFADFEREAAALARCVKPGGVLAICHANFRFADCSVASQFEPVLRIAKDPRTPVYDRDDRRIEVLADEEVLFRRRVPRP